MAEQNQIYDMIIIGGGPAGLSAAIYSARGKLRTLVIDKSPLAGAMNLATWIENYPGIPEAISGAELLSRIRQQAQHFGAEIVQDQVIGVDFTAKPRQIMTLKDSYLGTTVIITSGAMGRKPAIKGEADFVGKGVVYCAECDAPFFEDKDVVVAGRLDLLQEELPMIAKFARHIYLVPAAQSKSSDIEKIASDPKVEVLSGQTVNEIIGDNFVNAVSIKDKSGAERKLPVSGIFLYLQGRVPIVDFLSGSVNLDGDQCIIINRENMSTSIEGVFAAGDVTCKKVRQSVFATAEGSLAAITAMTYINSQRKPAFSQV